MLLYCFAQLHWVGEPPYETDRIACRTKDCISLVLLIWGSKKLEQPSFISFRGLIRNFQCLSLSLFHIVRRHSSKFQANCALFDTSMKLGTLIGVTITNIFRYIAKLEMNRFPWQPLFIKIPKMSPRFPANTLISVVLTCFPCS